MFSTAIALPLALPSGARPTPLVDAPFVDTPACLAELRALLVTSYAQTGRPDSWLVGRLDDWRYGANAQRDRAQPGFFAANAHLWRGPGGALLGFCVSEDGGDGVFLAAHPQLPALEASMLDWAETVWAAGRDTLVTYAFTHQEQRIQRLQERGYTDTGECGRLYTYSLAHAPGPTALPTGFRITSVAESGNVDSHIAAVRSAFGRATLDRDWYTSKVTAPTYAAAWDLAVVGPDDEHVAFCTAHLDTTNRIAELDPIGTRPEFQRYGLAKALVSECFRRLRDCGIRFAYIGAGAEPAVGNRLYLALRPTIVAPEHAWRKQLTQPDPA